MKKYGLFAFACYYPDGGFDDFRFDFNDAEEFKSKYKENPEVYNNDILQIVNFETGLSFDVDNEDSFRCSTNKSSEEILQECVETIKKGLLDEEI